MFVGIATHYVLKASLGSLIDELFDPKVISQIELSKSSITMLTQTVMGKFQGIPENPNTLSKDMGKINYFFAVSPSFEKLEANLLSATTESAETSIKQDLKSWSSELLQLLSMKCLISVRLTYNLITRGIISSYSDCLQQEYRAMYRLIRSPDFSEGISAVIIRRQTSAPAWIKNPLEIEKIIVEALDNTTTLVLSSLPTAPATLKQEVITQGGFFEKTTRRDAEDMKTEFTDSPASQSLPEPGKT
jgi:hypothetical protein